MSNSSNILWASVYKRVQHLIGVALRDYRPPLAVAEGAIPPTSLPPGGPGGTGYPPIPATPTTAGGVVLAGDLSGTATDPIVVAVQNVPYSSTAPTVGQVYQWNGTAMVPSTLTLTPTDVLNTLVTADTRHPTRTLHQLIDDLYAMVYTIGGSTDINAWGFGNWAEFDWGEP